LLKKKKKRKAKKQTMAPNAAPSRASINKEVSSNGFTVYGGIRKGGLLSPQSQLSMRRPGSKNRLIVKDGVVQKESKARSKPRVPAFVRPKPQKMIKKEPEILAQSPELVEVDRDVNILGEDIAHLSNDEGGAASIR